MGWKGMGWSNVVQARVLWQASMFMVEICGRLLRSWRCASGVHKMNRID